MITIKRTWKRCTNEKVNKIFQDILDKAIELYPGYFRNIKPTLYIIDSTTWLGFCSVEYPDNIPRNCYGGYDAHIWNPDQNIFQYKDAVILLNRRIMNDERSVIKTLVHEMAHYVTPLEHHSNLWETRMNKIGKFFDVSCTSGRFCDSETSKVLKSFKGGRQKEKPKYMVRCVNCGRIVERKRMCSIISTPFLWHCGHCNGSFERIIGKI